MNQNIHELKSDTHKENREVCKQNSKNRPTYGDFDFSGVGSPTSPKYKTHKKIVLHSRTYIPTYIYTWALTYISFIKIKGPFWIHSLHSLTHFTTRQ